MSVSCSRVAFVRVGVAAALVACASRPVPVPEATVSLMIPPPPAASAEDAEDGELEMVGDQSDLETEPHRGVWEGRGRQDDGQTWPIRLEVQGWREHPCATVQYPPHETWDASCSGVWDCDPAQSTSVLLVGTERIVEGEDRCIQGCGFRADLGTGIVEFDCSHAGVMGQAALRRLR
ncbi:MAG: hypothetical protein JW751_29270 [Polyangiaceae bacterium]|nr:hypothetical protein [Polyangiaceae bacterium]